MLGNDIAYKLEQLETQILYLIARESIRIVSIFPLPEHIIQKEDSIKVKKMKRSKINMDAVKLLNPLLCVVGLALATVTEELKAKVAKLIKGGKFPCLFELYKQRRVLLFKGEMMGARVAALEDGVAEVKNGVAEVKDGVAALEDDVAEIKSMLLKLIAK